MRDERRAALRCGTILHALVIIWLAAFSRAASADGCEGTVTLGAIEWPPYTIWEGDRFASGLDIDLMAAIFGKAGCKLHILRMPFKRALKNVELGNLDGMPTVSFTETRAGFGHYSVPVRDEVIAAFVRASLPEKQRPQSFETLKASTLRIGVVLGGWYGPAFEQALASDPGFQSRVSTFEDFETLFRALEAGLIDVAVNDIAGGRYVAERTVGSGTIQLLPFAVHVNSVHILLSRKTQSEATLAALDQAINAMREDGTIDQITERYLPVALLEKFVNTQP